MSGANPSPPSKAVEDFLKAIYRLQQGMERVSTNALKDSLSISAPSVTDMAQRLVESGLIDYRKYYGVRLTEEGESIALKIIRRHRLIELYLVQELGYDLHEVHDEAEALEHAVSDRFVDALNEKLGAPSFDPHGDPIPAEDGTIALRELYHLTELPLHTPARVSRLTAHDADMLQHTLDKGFHLEALVTVIARDPFNGPLTLRVGGVDVVLGYFVADSILVEQVDEAPPNV